VLPDLFARAFEPGGRLTASARFSELKREGKIVPVMKDGEHVSRRTRLGEQARAYIEPLRSKR
jgi:hypothetical protein